MGRARNTFQPTAAVDGFTAVFGGTRRGLPTYDLSGPGTAPGVSAEVGRLLKTVAAGDFSEALLVLRRHQTRLRDLEANPVLERLVSAMSAQICAHQDEERTCSARAGLAGVGVAEAGYSPHIIVWRRGGQMKLHVWADGHRYQAHRNPQSYGMQRTVCGRDMSGGAWTRARRGQWAEIIDEGPARSVALCPKCLAGGELLKLPDFTERAELRFFVPGQTREAGRCERVSVRTAILATVRFGGALEPRLAAVWRHDLIVALAAAADAAGGFTLDNLLPFESAVALAAQSDLTRDSYQQWAQLLSRSDWEKALAATAPPGVAPNMWEQSGWSKRLATVIVSMLQERGHRYPRAQNT